MDDKTTTPAAPAGTPAQFDMNTLVEAVNHAVNAALPGAVNAAVKPITEQVQSLQQSLANAPTTESVSKAVTDAITAQQTQQAIVGERQKFISEHLKGIPDAYHSHIGDDPAKFAEQEQHLRNVLKGDLETLGVKADNLGGDAAPGSSANPGIGTPKAVTAAVDTSKLSGVELLRMGVADTSGTPGGVTQPGDGAKATTAPAPGSATTTTPTADAAK